MKKYLALLLLTASLFSVGCSQFGKNKDSCCGEKACECQEAKPKGSSCEECARK